MRLIDADVVIHGIEELMCSPWYCDYPEEQAIKKETMGIVKDLCVIDAPTIDAVPVVHGKWLPVSVDPADPYFRCSVCHYGTDTIFDGGEEPFKYCPNCGARMDAKE